MLAIGSCSNSAIHLVQQNRVPSLIVVSPIVICSWPKIHHRFWWNRFRSISSFCLNEVDCDWSKYLCPNCNQHRKRAIKSDVENQFFIVQRHYENQTVSKPVLRREVIHKIDIHNTPRLNITPAKSAGFVISLNVSRIIHSIEIETDLIESCLENICVISRNLKSWNLESWNLFRSLQQLFQGFIIDGGCLVSWTIRKYLWNLRYTHLFECISILVVKNDLSDTQDNTKIGDFSIRGLGPHVLSLGPSLSPHSHTSFSVLICLFQYSHSQHSPFNHLSS